MLGPLLIAMSRDWHTTVPAVAQLVTSAAVAWAATAIVVGPFSDAYGRKPIYWLAHYWSAWLQSVRPWLRICPVAAVFRILSRHRRRHGPTHVYCLARRPPALRKAGAGGRRGHDPAGAEHAYSGSRSSRSLPPLPAGKRRFWPSVRPYCSARCWCFSTRRNRTPSGNGSFLAAASDRSGRFSVTWLLAFTNLTVRTAYGTHYDLLSAFSPSDVSPQHRRARPAGCHCCPRHNLRSLSGRENGEEPRAFIHSSGYSAHRGPAWHGRFCIRRRPVAERGSHQRVHGAHHAAGNPALCCRRRCGRNGGEER